MDTLNSTTLAGVAYRSDHIDGTRTSATWTSPDAMYVTTQGMYVSDGNRIRMYTRGNDSISTVYTGSVAARLRGVVWHDASASLYVLDHAQHHLIRVNSNVTRTIGVDVGYVDGDGNITRWDAPTGMDVDGDVMYVADTGNHVIRQIRIGSDGERTHCNKRTWAGMTAQH